LEENARIQEKEKEITMVSKETILFYKPSLVITTSRRKSPLTNTFIKCLSRLLGAPILRRGTSSLDEIAYFVSKEGYEGFIVTYTRLGNPSVLTFYRINQQGFFEMFGRLFILGVYINRSFRGNYDFVALTKECSSDSCDNVYAFLKDFFSIWQVDSSYATYDYSLMRVKELEEFRETWLIKFKNDPKFQPATIEFRDSKMRNVLLRIRVHHAWRSGPESK